MSPAHHCSKATFPWPYVRIDPCIQVGHPVIDGTRVPTRMLARSHRAGESIRDLADDYDLSEDQVEAAIRYESSVLAVRWYAVKRLDDLGLSAATDLIRRLRRYRWGRWLFGEP